MSLAGGCPRQALAAHEGAVGAGLQRSRIAGGCHERLHLQALGNAADGTGKTVELRLLGATEALRDGVAAACLVLLWLGQLLRPSRL